MSTRPSQQPVASPEAAPVPAFVTSSGVEIRQNPALPEPPPPPPPIEPLRDGPDAVIVPEGQILEVIPQEILDAVLEGQASDVTLTPEWTRARDAFVTKMRGRWAGDVLAALAREVRRIQDSSPISAEDLCQLVFIALSRKFEVHAKETGKAWAPENEWKPETEKGFLLGVAHNLAWKHARAKGRRPGIERGVQTDETPDTALDPEASIIAREAWARFDREHARLGLTQVEAEVFKCRGTYGLTFRAIAGVFKRNLPTVQDQYRRAVTKLRAHLSPAELAALLGGADAED